MNGGQHCMGGRGTDWIRRNSGEPDRGGHMAAKFVLKKGSTGKFRFNLLAPTAR
jgi:hypothetical protein